GSGRIAPAIPGEYSLGKDGGRCRLPVPKHRDTAPECRSDRDGTAGPWSMSGNSDNSRARSDVKSLLARLGYGSESGARPRVFTADELRRQFARRKDGQASSLPAGGGQSGPGAPLVYRRDSPRAAAAGRPPTMPLPDHAVRLEEAVEGRSVPAAEGGPFYLVSRRVCEIASLESVADRFAGKLAQAGSGLGRCLAEVAPAAPLGMEDILFVDIETTGLSSSPLFLIGAMVWDEGGFVVRQLLARTYAEERPVVAAFAELCRSRRLLVTFNGKSFDVPYIRTRAAATGAPFVGEQAHLDLLHVSRRCWRNCLPDCKLQTLERMVCRRSRHGDIPGSRIPEVYHTFVRTENACQIVDVLRHNMLDLVTLADIMTRLPDGC
ncbi:MAG: ribonuclease H-like domain-containing protein, partial [Lentisphaeria bacterium]|nr:ribonuclease H-like domain-containing protein [Lentisphaeria bacterium]